MTKVTSSGKAPPPAPPARKYKMHALGTLVPNLTKAAFRKRSPSTVTIMTDWAEIVGPQLAAATLPRRLTAGTLTIGCSGPTAMELQHQATQLIERINSYCGKEIVTKLRAVQDVTAMNAISRTSPARTPAPVAVDNMPDGPLKDALGRLGARIAERGRVKRKHP